MPDAPEGRGIGIGIIGARRPHRGCPDDTAEPGEGVAFSKLEGAQGLKEACLLHGYRSGVLFSRAIGNQRYLARVT